MNAPIPFVEALARISEVAASHSLSFLRKSESVSLDVACGRLSFEPLFASEEVPRFNNSTMDGFVVRSQETQKASASAPQQFEVLGQIVAGDAPLLDPCLEPFTCYEITTGAPIPQGYDAVYKIEETQPEYDDLGKAVRILVTAPLSEFENFRSKGSDFPLGGKIIDVGTVLMPEQLMALASVGIFKVSVLKKPRVAVLATGSEVSEPTEAGLKPGKIWNSTSPYLLSALPYLGVEVRYYGRVMDEKAEFTRALENILKDKPDIILTTGAVSKGLLDFIPEVIKNRGAEISFHNVAIRPGKPQLFGKFVKEEIVFFGLPGNPISTAVGIRFLLNEYVRRLQGRLSETAISAILTEDAGKPPGLHCFFKAKLELLIDGPRVTALKGQHSYIVSSLLLSNAWVVLEEGSSLVPAGSQVAVYPLYPFHYNYADNTFIPGHNHGSQAGGCC